jgi:hypothetical protein
MNSSTAPATKVAVAVGPLLGDPVPVIRDRYELLDIAGRGGHGEVWLALDHQHDGRVAIGVGRRP